MPSNVDQLRDRFVALLGRLGGAGDSRLLFDELVRLHTHPTRHYHNLRHIAECLELLDSVRDKADRPEAVEMAVWYHDAIYDATRSDNEERSAELARTRLGESGVEGQFIGEVCGLILVTRHREELTTLDGMLIADVDLSILGAPRERFDEYEAEVRREYAHVEDAAFRAGRSTVLRAFLTRPRIYQTEQIWERFEQKARANLAGSLKRLESF